MLGLRFFRALNILAVVNDEGALGVTSSQPAKGAVPVVLPLREVGKKSDERWTLTLHPSHLALADAPGAQPYVILREHLMKSAVLIEGMRAFSVQQPRKISFQLAPEGVIALTDWIGKPFLAAFYLRRRYAYVLLWATLLVVGSLISLLPSAHGGVEIPFDPYTLGFGLLMLVAAAFARWRPRPVLFLVDSTGFVFLAARLTLEVLNGRSMLWLLLVALLAWVAVNGVKHFFRFRTTRIEPLKK